MSDNTAMIVFCAIAAVFLLLGGLFFSPTGQKSLGIIFR